MSRSCPYCGERVAASKAAQFCGACGRSLATSGPLLAVQLAGVSKAFGGRSILSDLSLEVPAGECLVVVGMSGSGKSVLLEHIVGFQQPDSGTVQIMGVDLNRPPSPQALEEVRARLSLVFQGSALIDSLSVIENVMLPLLMRSVSRDVAHRQSFELLKAVGLSASDAELSPAQLSGGMQKRVGIARALITQPAVVLYDEPTTGLDAASSSVISRLIRSVQQRDPQMASITITHDYLSAGLIADRVLYLDPSCGQLREVLGRDEIADIRRQHGGKSPAAVQALRGQLEAFFDRLQLPERPPQSHRPAVAWWQAFTVILTRLLSAVGSSALLALRLGVPTDRNALLRRFDEIGIRSLPVAAAAGAFFGMMLALQIGVGLSGTGLMDPLPRIVGNAVVDKIGPLVVGLLLAGRVAASTCAELGGKRLSRQFDALRSMSVSPERYWLTPIFWASIISLPLLTIALELVAFAGAYCVAVGRYHVKSSFFMAEILAEVTPFGFVFGLVRAAVFGGAVALVGYQNGTQEMRSSDDVGRATTTAVVAASLAVIVLDFVMLFVASL